MNIIELPVSELSNNRYQAKVAIKEVVFDALGLGVAGQRLFSGFDGSCVEDGVYMPNAEHTRDNFVYGATAYEWERKKHSGLADIGHWATNYEIPAVGVYDLEQLDPVKALLWQTKNGISLPQTCTDIFIWQ